MPNDGIIVKITAFDHPKIKKLMRRLGVAAFYNLTRLWAYTAAYKPDGVLIGREKDDIEIAADWQGDDGVFVDTLIDIGLIDCKDGVCSIHDWAEHNSYAAGAGARSAKAKAAAKIRWEKKNGNTKPYSKQRPTISNNIQNNVSAKAKRPPCPHKKIMELYEKLLPQLPKPTLTKNLKTKMRARWAEDINYQSIDWWAKYFEDISKSTFLSGGNNRGWTPDLDWLCGATNMTKVLNGRYKNPNRFKGPPAPNTYAQCQDLERRQRTQWLLNTTNMGGGGNDKDKIATSNGPSITDIGGNIDGGAQ